MLLHVASHTLRDESARSLLQWLSTLTLRQNHLKVDKFITSEPQPPYLQNWHNIYSTKLCTKCLALCLGYSKASIKMAASDLFFFGSNRNSTEKHLYQTAPNWKLQLYYSLALWSCGNPPTSPSLTCNREKIGYLSAGFLKTKENYIDSWPILSCLKLGVMTVTITSELEWTLEIQHLHFITNKIGAWGNEEICPQSWPFPEPPSTHTHEYTDRV